MKKDAPPAQPAPAPAATGGGGGGGYTLKKHPGSRPADALQFGHRSANGPPLYLIVANAKEGRVPAKAHEDGQGYYPYGGKEIPTKDFDWVCGNQADFFLTSEFNESKYNYLWYVLINSCNILPRAISGILLTSRIPTDGISSTAKYQLRECVSHLNPGSC